MARELPIHNGRMTTDLDANGFKIKNLHPGSGFTQAQADWNQADATAPDFIKNKPTIPTPVAVDPTLTEQGAAADAKAVGDALRGGFTEWVCEEISIGWTFVKCDWRSSQTPAGWYADVVANDDPVLLSAYLPGDIDDVSIETEQGSIVAAKLTRHLITPTKTSQLTNDGAPNGGGNAYVMTNDLRLSDARTPTAHTHAMADVTGLNAALAQKADAADLPYRLVEPGEWAFSDGLNRQLTGPILDGEEVWYYYTNDNLTSQDFGTEAEASAALSLSFGDSLTATRPSLPGHLCDRAGNCVVVSGDTTLTLPAAVPGYLRDFLVRLEISGSSVPTITFAAPTGETLTYETDGDSFPVPDDDGVWLYSFTETAPSTFAVSLKAVQTVAAPTQGGS